MFKDELLSGSGDITVWINSPGGDCVAAAQIYNMLADYKGNVTVKIDGIAASAASVIAMAGDTVLMSPVSMMMIHNPATMAFGDHVEMAKAIEMLESVKDSIINAYAVKTGQSRAKLSHLMDAETWMDAGKAVELGFADGILERQKPKVKSEVEADDEDEVADEPENKDSNEPEEDTEDSSEEKSSGKSKNKKSDVFIRDTDEAATSSFLFSRKAMNTALLNKLEAKYGGTAPSGNRGKTSSDMTDRTASDKACSDTSAKTVVRQSEIKAPETETGHSVEKIMERLDTIEKFI